MFDLKVKLKTQQDSRLFTQLKILLLVNCFFRIFVSTFNVFEKSNEKKKLLQETN